MTCLMGWEMANPTRKVDTRTQVERLLGTLNRHSDVLSDALTGAVEPTEKAYAAGIDALVGINALIPVEEGVFHMNPRVRAYLSEQLAQYSAFQTLTRLSEQIHGARAKWNEILAIKASDDHRDLQTMEDSLTLTVTEINHYMVQNLLLLSTQISTDFGNVKSLRAKLKQNKFYALGVRNLYDEIRQLEAFCNDIDRESLGKGLHYIRQIVSSRIRVRLPEWMTKLNDIQASISKRLFQSKVLDVEVLLLSQSVLWLTRNPTLNGMDVVVDEQAPPALLPPTPIKVRPQVDVFDRLDSTLKILTTSVSRMPKAADPWAVVEKATVERVKRTSNVVQEVFMEVEDELVSDLVSALEVEGATPISGMEWQREKRVANGIEDESWLLFLASQLALQHVDFTFTMTKRDRGALNDLYEDVVAQPRPQLELALG